MVAAKRRPTRSGRQATPAGIGTSVEPAAREGVVPPGVGGVKGALVFVTQPAASVVSAADGVKTYEQLDARGPP
jgi:hypothetical protein